MVWETVFPHVCGSMFRITATYEGGSVRATGFVIARYKLPGKLAFAIATAEHVFRPVPMYSNVEWVLDRYDSFGKATGQITFKSDLALMGKSPVRANLVSDVGLLFAPPASFPLSPLPVLTPLQGAVPGIKVGWAGFPEFVTRKTGAPHPCYFEGVLSAVVDRVEASQKLFYLVDGHGGRGVSGGPLWAWDEDAKRFNVVGICSQYLGGDQSFPGMVVFEAINPVVAYLQQSGELELDVVTGDAGPRPS